MQQSTKIAVVGGLVAAGGLWYWNYRRQYSLDDPTGDDEGNPTGQGSLLGSSTLSAIVGGLGLSIPLGLRIHNPGNLRFIASNPYNGQIGNYQGFGQYVDDESGCRAMGHQMQKDYTNGQRTVRLLTASWAPPSENDTAAYINAVCLRLGVLPDDPLDIPESLGYVMEAYITQEQGYCPFDVSDLQSWGTEL